MGTSSSNMFENEVIDITINDSMTLILDIVNYIYPSPRFPINVRSVFEDGVLLNDTNLDAAMVYVMIVYGDKYILHRQIFEICTDTNQSCYMTPDNEIMIRTSHAATIYTYLQQILYFIGMADCPNSYMASKGDGTYPNIVRMLYSMKTSDNVHYSTFVVRGIDLLSKHTDCIKYMRTINQALSDSDISMYTIRSLRDMALNFGFVWYL